MRLQSPLDDIFRGPSHIRALRALHQLPVGLTAGFPGAHSQAESLDELNRNLYDVVAMLLEDGEPRLGGELDG